MAEESKFFETTFGKREILLKHNAEQYEKILRQETAAYQKEVDDRLKAEKKLEDEISRLKAKGLTVDAEIEARLEKRRRERILAEEALEQERIKKHDEAMRIMETHEVNQYRRLSAAKRREYHASVYDELKEGEATRKKQIAAEEAAIKEMEKKRSAIKDKRGAGKAANEQAKKEIAEAQARLNALKAEQSKQDQARADATRFSKLELMTSKDARKEKTERNFELNATKIADAQDKVAEKSSRLDALNEEWKQSKKNQLLEKKIAAAKASGNKAELAHLKKQQADARAAWEKKSGYLEAEKELSEANFELEKAQRTAIKDSLKDTGSELIGNFVDASVDKISGHLTDMYGSQSRMAGRLQGSGVNWQLELLDVTTTVGLSGLVKQKNVVAKMVELVDSGVAYNLEMRAFLSETANSIASTFDAANGTLLRMIRLQQADTTAARLGMEASLTKLFNEYFKDTSYLTDSGPADAVTTAIMDASATMDKNESLAFEFNVQKWLGSLYSLGMSSDAIDKVAQGINYIGTGNVAALSGDPALQTLFAMSASKAGGKSYAQMLTQGITAEDTNKLLKAMVEYLAEIANSQTNLVTKSAYADLFNMSVTDLSAFASLTTKEISNLYKSTTDYSTLMTETQTQLNQLITRMSVAEMIDNVIENAEVGAASLIGSNPVTYGMWKALAVLKEYVGEVKIPGVIGMGTGISSGLDLLNLAQTAMAGMGLIGSLVAGVASMTKGGATNLDAWDFSEYTSRGSTLSVLDAGSFETTSYSASIGVGGGAGSGEVAADVSLETGKEKGMEASGITSEEMEEQQDLPQKIYDALAGENTPTVLSLLQEIDDRLDLGRVFYTAMIEQSSSAGAVSQINNLSTSIATAQSVSGEEGTSTSSSTTRNSNTSGTSLSGAGSSAEEGQDMQSIIAAAVEQAIRNIAGYSSGNGLPVTVTNLTNGGVM